MTNIENKKKLSKILALACAFTLAISSFAYFTDRVNTDAITFTADDNAIIIDATDPEVTPTDPDAPVSDKIEEIWTEKNDDIDDNMVPGDSFDLSYTLENKGNSAIDVRETIVLTSDVAMDTTSPEFRMFLTRTTNTLGGYDGGTVVSVETINNSTKITYNIPAFVLSGVEKVSGAEATSKALTYYFVFDRYAGNAFQGATATIDYLIEVKQHSDNGPTGGWAELATATTTMGGSTVAVVPEA